MAKQYWYASTREHVVQRIEDFNADVGNVRNYGNLLHRLQQVDHWVADLSTWSFAPALFAGLVKPPLSKYGDRDRVPPTKGTDNINALADGYHWSCIGKNDRGFQKLQSIFEKWKDSLPVDISKHFHANDQARF